MSDLWAVNLLALIVISYLSFHNGFNIFRRDDSDSAESRSNLIVYTDYGTGNQWIKSFTDTSLTPRIGADGRQINIYHNRLAKKQTEDMGGE